MLYEWYEIWADETHDLPYILLLCPSTVEHDKCLIIDPKENDKIVDILPDYESAKLWLLEDEFILVRGRMFDD
jgi:hypothetical protein